MAKIQKKFIDPDIFLDPAQFEVNDIIINTGAEFEGKSPEQYKELLKIQDEISFFDKSLEKSYEAGFFNLFNPEHLGEDLGEKLDRILFDIYNPEDAVPVHTHDNASILNNTEESFTTVLKEKIEEINIDFILSHLYGYYNIYNPLYQ
jgi:hypothetical protein